MRLQDTLTGSLVELPPPPEQVGIYVCGPTVYQRAHIGNARPFVVFMWLAGWLRERGYEVWLVHNITDVNDKIYEAAPGRSAERALEATAWYLEDTAGFGLGMPDAQPLATETIAEIVELIEELIESGHAYDADGDVYFRVARFDTYGALSGQRPDEVEEQEPNPAKEDPRDFALWKATKEGEDTSWESPWGPAGPAGTSSARRWPRSSSAASSGSTAAGSTSSSRTTRTSARSRWRSATRSRGSGCTTGCSGSPARRCPSRSATSRRSRRCSTSGDRRPRSCSSSRRTGASRSTSPTTTMTAAGRRRRRSATPCGASRARRATGISSPPRSTTTSTRPAALAIMHEWARIGALDELRRGLDVFGLASLAAGETAPPEVVALAEARVRRERRRTSEADRLRTELEAEGWEVRDVAEPPFFDS